MQEITLRLPVAMVADIAEIAAARGDSFDDVVEAALMHAINRPKDYYGVTLRNSSALCRFSQVAEGAITC